MEKEIIFNFKCILTLLAYCKLHANLSQTKRKRYHIIELETISSLLKHNIQGFSSELMLFFSSVSEKKRKVMFSAAKGLSHYE